MQFLDHLDLDEANRQLKEDIADGASAFWVQFGGNIPYGGAFLGARRVEALEKVFAGSPWRSTIFTYRAASIRSRAPLY
ncbi:MAG: hypothetical protein HC850_15650 [Rhodomicrobium sp.]|nr:hypothetical protein [Rhodomicrobium sp.]